MTAEERLLSWMAGANALSLLQALERTGALSVLCEPTDSEAFGKARGIGPQHAERILMALNAAEVVERVEGGYRLVPEWQHILRDDRPAALRDRLGFLDPVRLGLASVLEQPAAFDEVSEQESEKLARSVWGVATSPEALTSWAALDAAMPEVRKVWEGGARHAEFGCGAGRDLVRIPAMYPNVEAVGYDILEGVLKHARNLANRAGVGDRVVLRVQNVLEIDEENAFDTIMWSHMFFAPGAVRDRAIAVIRKSLRPGGYLIIPFMAALPQADTVKATPAMLFFLTISVAYRRWNIYWPRAEELRDELENVGFRHVATIAHPRTPFMALQLE
jgi:SAM-dependent methyltransferase